MGDDARGHGEEAVAPEEPGQGLPGVDAADMQVGAAVGEQPDAVAPAGGPELQLDLGKRGMEGGDGGHQDGLHPHRSRGDPEAAGAPGKRRDHGLLAVLDLAQDAPGALGDHGAEFGEPDAGRDTFEQAALVLLLEAGDDAGERRLGHGEAVGRRDDPFRLDDGEELHQVAAPFEHLAAPCFRCGLQRLPHDSMWGSLPGFRALPP